MSMLYAGEAGTDFSDYIKKIIYKLVSNELNVSAKTALFHLDMFLNSISIYLRN